MGDFFTNKKRPGILFRVVLYIRAWVSLMHKSNYIYIDFLKLTIAISQGAFHNQQTEKTDETNNLLSTSDTSYIATQWVRAPIHTQGKLD